MINLIGNAPESQHYRQGTFVQFLSWERMQRSYQLDIETNVTPWWCDKKLICLQFGSADGKEKWVIQWSSLQPEARVKLKSVLEDHTKTKIIHNAMFECVVLLFHGIRITNIYDTMLMEMVLYCGMVFKEDENNEDDTEAAAGFYALTSLTNRYLQHKMDKTEQTNFGDDILTESKVIYAAADVHPLAMIMNMQKLKLHEYDLEYVAALENGVVTAYAEMTYHGMEIDKDKWRANIDFAMPLIQKAKAELDKWLEHETFWRKAVELGYYDPLDRITINWNSPVQKKEIVEHFFPFLIDKISKPVLTRLLKQHAKTGDVFSDDRVIPYIEAFRDGNWPIIETAITEIDRDWLINKEYLVPGGHMTINWGSRAQVLPIFRVVQPKLAGLAEDDLGKFHHPIGRSLENYKDNMKLITTYGEVFLTGNSKKLPSVEPDGKVRATVNQVVSTGRISIRRPNMQNIPAKPELEISVDGKVIAPYTRYRNAFICSPSWRYVSSDFMSQELVIIAYLSQDPVWMEALRKNQDLHSVCAALIYRKKWTDATEANCMFYKMMWYSETEKKWLIDEEYATANKPAGYIRQQRKDKCKCNGHKTMRTNIKPVDFGLAYGMSKYKLSSDLRITVYAAEELMNDYFRTFPKIGSLLSQLGYFGVRKGYIQTIAPFFRKRWFPYWKFVRSNIDAHIRDIKYDPTLGAIERASKNMPIQGTAGDMAKLSLLLLYQRIHDPKDNISDKVHLIMQVHDQNDTVAREDFAEQWKVEMEVIMREAALFIIPNGMLGAETTISTCWTK